ncbi:aKG-HExxH-type peptide beta-hydroxylase [Streptomyces sp. GLT-R25]
MRTASARSSRGSPPIRAGTARTARSSPPPLETPTLPWSSHNRPDAVRLAETLVHEFQHSKLAALLHHFPLLDDDRIERFYAPWRSDPRHLTGLLHGAYAFTGVAGFWRLRMHDPSSDTAVRGFAAYHFALRRLQARLVVRTLGQSGRLAPLGTVIVDGLARTLTDWLHEDVPQGVLYRARTAARLHRTEWRLRNLRPPLHEPMPSDSSWARPPYPWLCSCLGEPYDRRRVPRRW